MVTAWVQDNGMHLYPNTDIGGKYNVLQNGELYINNASPSDGFKTYTCRTINRLTGKQNLNFKPNNNNKKGKKMENQPFRYSHLDDAACYFVVHCQPSISTSILKQNIL